MEPDEPTRFRDLPGIAELEAQCLLAIENRLMSDELQAFAKKLDEKSLELFGITERDTDYYSVPRGAAPASLPQWEQNFEFLEWEWEEEDEFWAAFGLDLRDENGDRLACIDSFGRQLVCAVRRLHPNAALLFRQGAMTEHEMKAAAEAWGRRLIGGER